MLLGMFGSIGCGIDVNGLGMEQATLTPLNASAATPEPDEAAVDAGVSDAPDADPYAAGMAFCTMAMGRPYEAAKCGLPAKCGITCVIDPAFPNSGCC